MNKNIIPDYVDEVLKKIIDNSKPVSIFLYGSMARDDFENDSDYEIGVVYKRDDKLSRSQLKELNEYENIKIYPFVYEDLKTGEVDTPFPKYFYLREIAESSTTLYGEKIESIVSVPKLDVNNLYETVGFYLGRTYSAIVSSRQNDLIATVDGFTKSGLHGLQMLIFIKTGKFVSSYKEIEKETNMLVQDEYKELIQHIFDVRKGITVLDTKFLYKNISFLNKVVLKAIKDADIIR